MRYRGFNVLFFLDKDRSATRDGWEGFYLDVPHHVINVVFTEDDLVIPMSNRYWIVSMTDGDPVPWGRYALKKAREVLTEVYNEPTGP